MTKAHTINMKLYVKIMYTKMKVKAENIKANLKMIYNIKYIEFTPYCFFHVSLPEQIQTK